MASQSFSIGTPTHTAMVIGVPAHYMFTGAVELDDALHAVGEVNVWWRIFRAYDEQLGSSFDDRISLVTSETQSGVTASSEDLSIAWEQNATAIVLTRSGDSESFTVRGPNATGVVSDDTEEPYTWQPPSTEDGSALYDWIAARSSDTYTMLLDDGESQELFKGAMPLDAVYRGSDQVQRIYKGETLIFGSEP